MKGSLTPASYSAGGNFFDEGYGDQIVALFLRNFYHFLENTIFVGWLTFYMTFFEL